MKAEPRGGPLRYGCKEIYTEKDRGANKAMGDSDKVDELKVDPGKSSQLQ